MKNVVSFATRKTEVVETRNESEEFIFDIFYDWARTKGIDTTTTEFKYNAATVMTVVQSLLHERD